MDKLLTHILISIQMLCVRIKCQDQRLIKEIEFGSYHQLKKRASMRKPISQRKSFTNRKD